MQNTISFRRRANWESTDDVRYIELCADDADIAEGVDEPDPASLRREFCSWTSFMLLLGMPDCSWWTLLECSLLSPTLFRDGISNPILLLKPKDVGCKLLSSPEFALNDADPGWKVVVNAFSEGGKAMSLNRLDICGSIDVSSLPNEDTPKFVLLPYNIREKNWLLKPVK